MERFLKAVELTGVEFKECVDFVGNCWLPARVYVEEAINGRHKLDPSGEIIALSTVRPFGILGVEFNTHRHTHKHTNGRTCSYMCFIVLYM